MSKFSKSIIPGSGSKIQEVKVKEGEVVGYKQVTVSSAAVGLSAPSRANKAVISVDDATIRYRIDGGDPTSSNGHVLYPGNSIVIDSDQQVNAFKAIRTGSSDATLNVSFYEK